MEDGKKKSEVRLRSLAVDFAGWLDDISMQDKEAAEFYDTALIVLDANVLLHLYEIGAVARTEVFVALAGVGSRLWIPHQAALEFSRNRKRVVIDRTSRFASVRRSLQTAARDAAQLLENTVDQVVELRKRNRTSRPCRARLDRSSLEAHLGGILNSALSELDDLEAEHDVHPRDMQERDTLFSEINRLLTGRIGLGPSRAQLRSRVEEAIDFRFPNQIPPGYSDASKKTSLAAAGDYLLWREVLDKACDAQPSTSRVLLVTSDMKPDWWMLDKKGVPIRAHPELVHEMRSEAGAELLIVSLANFVDDVREYLSVHVSDDTVEQLREVALESESVYDVQSPGTISPESLLTLSILDFEQLVRDLLFRMGYTTLYSASVDSGYDVIVRDANGLVPSKVVVQVKRYRHPVGVHVIREIFGAMTHLNADAAVIVTTSNFNSSALAFARGKPIRLIDGTELLHLLARHGLS